MSRRSLLLAYFGRLARRTSARINRVRPLFVLTILISPLLLLVIGCSNPRNESELSKTESELQRIREELELTKQKAETELTNAKTKLAEAQRELELARAATQLTVPQSLPPVTRPSRDWTVLQILDGYLKAPSLAHRLQFVKEPDVVRPLMESHYQGSRWHPVVDYKIEPFTAGSDSFIVNVQFLEDRSNNGYVVVKTPEGFRVDWKATIDRRIAEKDAAFRQAHGLIGATLQIELLKRDDSSYPDLTFKFTNASDAHIKDATLECDGYGNGNRYLQRALIFLKDIPPRGSSIEDATLVGIAASDLKSWKFKLTRLQIVSGESTQYVEKFFSLRTLE